MLQPDQPRLSIVMVAINEECTIGEVLAAVQPIADEIIVVDSGSTDRTREIAQQYNARVIHRDWQGYAAQKNFALDLAVCDWVLNIDADEILTPDLVAEIKELLKKNSTGHGSTDKYVGFKLPRVLFIGDRQICHGGFYPDAQLRLIRKGAGRFKDRLVHESIVVNGPVRILKHHMLHKAYSNIERFQSALDQYALLSAQQFARQPVTWWQVSRLNELLHPVWTFFYRFVLRGGFLDGLLGFKLALIYSNYVAEKIRCLRRLTATSSTS